MTPSSDDYDTPWKDALTRYFAEFMAFYFRTAYADIDWQLPCEFLEQELAQVTRDAELGFLRVDKLVRVARRGVGEQWVLVHIDVQGNHDTEFAERVFSTRSAVCPPPVDAVALRGCTILQCTDKHSIQSLCLSSIDSPLMPSICR
jgi:hypothetical protein